MPAPKFLHVRIPVDFHQQLVKYAEDRFVPVSSVVLQAVAQTIGYKPRPATTRNYQQPVDDFGLAPETDDDLDMDELQRRANSAPYKPIR